MKKKLKLLRHFSHFVKKSCFAKSTTIKYLQIAKKIVTDRNFLPNAATFSKSYQRVIMQVIRLLAKVLDGIKRITGYVYKVYKYTVFFNNGKVEVYTGRIGSIIQEFNKINIKWNT